MRKFARVSLVDGAVEQLLEEIQSGRWPVGSKIPPESQLVEQLGMSRTPVREAIRSLVQSGLLVSRQGAGTYVLATDVGKVALRRRVEEADHEDVVQVRDGLDVVAANLAARFRTPEDLAELDRALQRREEAFLHAEAAAFVDADIDFHVGIARAGGNPLLLDLYSTLAGAVGHALHTAFDVTDESRADQALHGGLLEAVRNGDPDAAAAAALALLDHTRQSV